MTLAVLVLGSSLVSWGQTAAPPKARRSPGTPLPASVAGVALIDESNGLADVSKLGELEETLVELQRQRPGLLHTVRIMNGGGAGAMIWGTAGQGVLKLDWRVLERGGEFLRGIVVHEYGHLVYAVALPDAAAKTGWNDHFNEMFFLEAREKSPLLTWFSLRRLFPDDPAMHDGAYETAWNQAECFAMAFAIAVLWEDRFLALAQKEATSREEIALVRKTLMATGGRRWRPSKG